MKKQIVLLIFAVCGFVNIQAQTEQEVTAELKKVVVYPFEAELFSTAKVNALGTVLLKFTKLSPYIQQQSIRVVGDENLTILNVSFRKDFLSEKEKDLKIKNLQNKLVAFREKQKEINVQLSIINDRVSYLKSNETMGKESAVDPLKYKDLSNYFLSFIKENQEKLLVFNRQFNTLNDSINVYQQQVNELNNSQNELNGTILVLANVKESRASKLELSYMVSLASWTPSYDIRFEGVSKPLSLSYKAAVAQQSGCDWVDSRFTFSTAQTQKTSDIPLLHPLYLGYVYKSQNNYGDANVIGTFDGSEIHGVVKDEKGETVIGATIKVKGTDIVVVTDINGQFSLRRIPPDSRTLSINYVGMEPLELSITGNEFEITLKEKSKELDEIVVTGYGVMNASYADESGENVSRTSDRKVLKPDLSLSNYQKNFSAQRKPIASSFDVDEAQTVKTGKSTLIPFKQEEVPCIFQYKSIPKLSEKVYLTGSIPNWYELDLQSGDANLYFGNNFIGKTRINATSMTDTLTVSFGPDQGISIKREKIKDFTENVSLSSKQQQTVSWRIVVKNNKNEAVKVDVFDQLPLTNQDDIAVKALELSGGELNKTTGEVKWPVSLPAGGSKELIFSVQVKYPKGRRVILK